MLRTLVTGQIRPPRSRQGRAGRAGRGAEIFCLAAALALLALSPACRHWFLLPALACGLICAQETRHSKDWFNPTRAFGYYGVYFFYLAPALHVALDFYFVSPTFPVYQQPLDWRTWIGAMAICNLCGLLLFRFVRARLAARRAVAGPRPQVWVLDRLRLSTMTICLSLVCAGALYYLWQRFGGPLGIISNFSNALAAPGSATVQGLGWIFCIANGLPLLLFSAWALETRRIAKPVLAVLATIAIMLPATVLAGGLYGSRSNVVYGIIVAITVLNLRFRRLSASALALACAVLLCFMYGYGLYKAGGENIFTRIHSVAGMTAASARTGRTMDGLLLGDLDRADVQAYELFIMYRHGGDVSYAFGRTFVADLLAYVPHQILPNRPPGKEKYGTDLFFGPGTYGIGITSTKIFGLAGEWMLNFGILGMFAAFAFYGWVVDRATSAYEGVPRGDPRQIITAFMPVLVIGALALDFDNLLFIALSQALLPALLVLASCRRAPRRAARVGALGRPFPEAWAKPAARAQ